MAMNETCNVYDRVDWENIYTFYIENEKEETIKFEESNQGTIQYNFI